LPQTMNSTKNRIKILLVEDNADDELLTVRAIKKSGFNVEINVARDGQEALDYLTSHQKTVIVENLPTLILLDLKLPKVDGLEVLKAIKTSDKFKLIPVVILTTSKEEQDLDNAYKLGVNSYVCKPVDATEFTDAIQKLGIYWFQINQTSIKGHIA